MSIFNMSTSMIEMFLSLNIKIIPKSIHHFICSKFIMMPC